MIVIGICMAFCFRLPEQYRAHPVKSCFLQSWQYLAIILVLWPTACSFWTICCPCGQSRDGRRVAFPTGPCPVKHPDDASAAGRSEPPPMPGQPTMIASTNASSEKQGHVSQRSWDVRSSTQSKTAVAEMFFAFWKHIYQFCANGILLERCFCVFSQLHTTSSWAMRVGQAYSASRHPNQGWSGTFLSTFIHFYSYLNVSDSSSKQ